MAGILMMKIALLPGLYRKRLVQKLLVEILLYVVDKDDCFALIIKLRTACSPHHLQHVYTHTHTHCYTQPLEQNVYDLLMQFVMSVSDSYMRELLIVEFNVTQTGGSTLPVPQRPHRGCH